ncbi:phosphatidylserine decarboxylase proenzyme, mitochondrial-like isoform X3 [Gigantopelta aegis]|uniref:phosphatidylserine decarboxylase proenzyme, mitochondrial-like isoform X3 n=1 Tax=Gigantopelta aegis TaxID=1735272 RepID=UPI001B88B80D|nr:phosphatidylserine decarboxylase proenzyme, mitochondrial-like isoform X3 [Gigantopelta aegis]
MMLVFEFRMLMMEYLYNQMDDIAMFSVVVIVMLAGGLLKTHRIAFKLTPFYLWKFGVHSFTFGIFNKKYYNVLNWGKIPTIHKSLNNKRKKYTLQLRTYCYGYKHLHHGLKKHHSSKRHNRMVTLYRKMPLKTMSRWWGQFNELCLPVFLRRPILGLYIWMFNVNLAEAQVENLRDYKNLGEFFRRTLKPNVRIVDDDHILTSPADGKILHYGYVHNGVLEQVKGMTYSLQGFFGPSIGSTNMSTDGIETEDDYYNRLGIQPGNRLFHCVIYLAPGDYHRFHSPAHWTIQHRRHFPDTTLWDTVLCSHA